MVKKDYSTYQTNIISRYYENLDTIILQRLGELITELYLAESQTKKKQLWERVRKAMEKLNVPSTIYEHIMAKKDVQILAKNFEDWLKMSKKK